MQSKYILRIKRIMFLVFILLFVLESSSFLELFGLKINGIRITFILILVLFYLIYIIGKNYGSIKILFKHGFYWLQATVIYFILLIIISFLYQNPTVLIFRDAAIYLFFLTGIILGTEKNILESFLGYMLPFFVLSIIITILSASYITSLDRVVTYNSQLYKLQYLFYPSLFLLILSPLFKKPIFQITIVFSYLIFLIEQLIFQKRFPIVKGLSFLIIFCIFYFIVKKSNISFKKKFILSFRSIFLSIIIILVMILIITNYIKIDLFISSQSLINRFIGFYGVYNTTMDDYRFYAPKIIYENIVGIENIIGKGFGSYITDSRLYWNAIQDSNFYGVTEIEVGHVFPYWKGGLIFFLLINIGFILVLFLFKRLKNNPIQLACWFFSVAYLLIFFVEAWNMTYLNLLLLGLCLGQCISADPLDSNSSLFINK